MFKNKKSVLLKFLVMFIVVCIVFAVFASCGKSVTVPIGNTINYGYVLVDGDDIYYSKMIINGGDFYSCIYKYNTKSGEDVLISVTEAEDILVMNGFLTLERGNLYFLSNYAHESYLEAAENISYIKPDGKTPNEISMLFEDGEVSCRSMQIVKGVIYYYDDMEEIICRINADGTNKRIINEEAAIWSYSNMCVSGNSIYYAEDEYIYEINVKGGEPKLILDTYDEFEDGYFDISYIIVDNKYIYYMDDEQSYIYRISTNGRNNELIYKAPQGVYIESFNVSEGVVYFVLNTSETYEIMSITPGATLPRAIVDRSNDYGDILPISIWGNTIYFLAMPSQETIMDSDYVWFTVNKNGGPVTPFQPFIVESDVFGNENEDGSFNFTFEEVYEEDDYGEEDEE